MSRIDNHLTQDTGFANPVLPVFCYVCGEKLRDNEIQMCKECEDNREENNAKK